MATKKTIKKNAIPGTAKPKITMPAGTDKKSYTGQQAWESGKSIPLAKDK